MYDDTEGVSVEEQTTWSTVISQEDVTEVAKFNLIQPGKYPGILVDVSRAIVTNEKSPLNGKLVARGRFTLTTEAGDKTLFVDLYPEIIKATSKAGGKYIVPACQNASMLYEALEMEGQDFEKVLEAAASTTLQFEVWISEPKDKQYKPKNGFRIRAYKG